MTRKPQIKENLDEIAETMKHFSTVAQRPVFFSLSQLWEIMEQAASFSGKRMTRQFPSPVSFGQFASKHQNIQTKTSLVKIDGTKGRVKGNLRSVPTYAYVPPLMNADDGINYGGVC